jgi:hypothetical protein
MKYKILIHYKTGDSFSSKDVETFLDGTWEDKNILKEIIKRIKDHNEWYLSNHSYRIRKNTLVVEPEWHKGKPENSIVFITDKGSEYLQSAFWCGYFETLYGAKVVAEQEPEIGFEY